MGWAPLRGPPAKRGDPKDVSRINCRGPITLPDTLIHGVTASLFLPCSGARGAARSIHDGREIVQDRVERAAPALAIDHLAHVRRERPDYSVLRSIFAM